MIDCDKLPTVEGFENDPDFHRDRFGFAIERDQFECARSSLGWHDVNGEAVSYLATAHPKMGPPPPGSLR